MWNRKRKVLTAAGGAAGGAIAGVVLLGGMVFAQTPTPDPSTPSAPGAPAQEAPAPRGPRGDGDRDCPGKDGGQGTPSTQTTSAPRY